MEKGGAAEHENHAFDRSCMQHAVQIRTDGLDRMAGETMEHFQVVSFNACDASGCTEEGLNRLLSELMCGGFLGSLRFQTSCCYTKARQLPSCIIREQTTQLVLPRKQGNIHSNVPENIHNTLHRMGCVTNIFPLSYDVVC